MKTKFIQMTLTYKQAWHIQYALDLYARINLGQLDTIQAAIGPHRPEKYNVPWMGLNLKEISDLKRLNFPELKPNQSYEIYHTEAPEICREMLDIYDVILDFLSTKENPQDETTANIRNHQQFSKESLPTITRIPNFIRKTRMEDKMKCKCGFEFAGPGEFRNCEAFITDKGESGVVCPKCNATYMDGQEIILKEKQ